MKIITNLKEKKVPLIIIATVIFLLFSRFYKILEVPTALVHDELIYVMQAKSLRLTGTDMSGQWNPWSLQPFNSAFAELPSILMSLAISSTANPILNAKLIHILVGIALPFVLSWFAFGIWKNKHFALCTLIVASVNPWMWQFSRMMFDSLFSVFFYLLAGAIILNVKNWWKLLALPALFFAFYQYQGLKLIFIPFILLVCGFVLIEKKLLFNKKFITSKFDSEIWSVLIISILSIILFFYYLMIALPQQSASARLSQIVFFEKEYITQEVTQNRQLSLITPVTSLVINKYSVVALTITKNVLKTLNPTFIFFAADEAANRFVTTKHGYLYLIDFLLILVGTYFLLKDSKMGKCVLYFLLLMVSLIPAVLTVGQSFTFRAALFYVLLLPLISYGITRIIETRKTIYVIAIVSVYALSVLNFTYHYFYQYPVYAADGQFFSERVLASYIDRIPKDRKVLVYSVDQEYLFNSYLFYNNLYNENTVDTIKQAITSNQFRVDNVEFRDTCIDPNQLDATAVLITPADPNICETNGESFPKTILQERIGNHLTVPAITDSGELYKIFSDTVCSQYDLGTYIAPRSSKIFSVEQLENEDFCKSWITNLAPLTITSD